MARSEPGLEISVRQILYRKPELRSSSNNLLLFTPGTGFEMQRRIPDQLTYLGHMVVVLGKLAPPVLQMKEAFTREDLGEKMN